jgi:hypothetical protein
MGILIQELDLNKKPGGNGDWKKQSLQNIIPRRRTENVSTKE